MKHVTFEDLLKHAVEETPLPCDCSECGKKWEDFRLERTRPQRVADNLSPEFWREQERALNRRNRTSLFRMPLLVAACFALIFVGLAVMVGPSRETAEPAVVLSEAEQEQLLYDVEEILDEPLLGDLEVLVQNVLTPQTQSQHLLQGGKYYET